MTHGVSLDLPVLPVLPVLPALPVLPILPILPIPPILPILPILPIYSPTGLGLASYSAWASARSDGLPKIFSPS